MTAEQIFQKFSCEKLTERRDCIVTCLDRLTPAQIWTRASENENAVGNLVLHLCGNLRQWIGFGVAGQPDIRERDREFSARGGIEPAELKRLLTETVRETTAIIAGLPVERFAGIMTVQGHTVTVLEGIYRIVDHFSLHAGQIMYATKLWTGSDLGFYPSLNPSPRSEQAR